MVSIVRIAFGLTILLLISCSKDLDDLTEVRYSGIIYIDEVIWIEKKEKLIIEAGTNITFGDNGSFQIKGEFEAIGTSTDQIQLIGSENNSAHTIIFAYQDEAINFSMEHVQVENGLIVTEAKNNRFHDVNIKNSKQLSSDDAMIRSWRGSFSFTNGSISSNNTGEGLLVHDCNSPIVSNSIFDSIPDAVEFIRSIDGEVSNSIFNDIPDDAIDNNNCERTQILNNEFYRVSDRALEIGSDGYGISTDINVDNNLFVDCHIGINVKEASSATVTSATFYNTRLNIELLIGDNGAPSSLSLNNSVMSGEHAWVAGEENSEFIYSELMSDQAIEGLSDVFLSNIEFSAPELSDFKIVSSNFPEGENAHTMGYQK